MLTLISWTKATKVERPSERVRMQFMGIMFKDFLSFSLGSLSIYLSKERKPRRVVYFL